MATQGEIFQFGEYRLDVRERRLWQGGVLISLAPKTFDLLVVMLADAGRLLKKEDLIRSVWPDSHVQDANLSVHIAGIRKTLGKSPDVEQFIETVPKVGYRFVAPVSTLLKPGLAPPSAVEHDLHTDDAATSPLSLLANGSYRPPVSPPQGANRPTPSRPFLLLIYVAVATVLLVGALRSVSAGKEAAGESEASTTPLSGIPGLFLQPAFSPDGQELAYTWRSNTSAYQSIYLQHVPGEERRKLIDLGGNDYSPAWSPDGKQIASSTAPKTISHCDFSSPPRETPL